MKIIGWIVDNKSWLELLAWVRQQEFDDHLAKSGSVPFRVEAILKEDGKMKAWDGTQIQWAKGFIAGHYAAKDRIEMSLPKTEPDFYLR